MASTNGIILLVAIGLGVAAACWYLWHVVHEKPLEDLPPEARKWAK